MPPKYDAKHYERLPLVHLCRFLEPVFLKDLPNKIQGGYSSQRWALYVSIEDLMGFLHSPGRGPHWQVTEVGRVACMEYLADRVIRCGTEAA